jgi:hypothetical protein
MKTLEKLDLASGRCCSDIWTSLTQSARHCGAFGRLQRLVRTVAQELTVLTWKLHGIFMDIFSETCDHTHGMKWDTVHITWRLWIEPIILLKSSRYKKCFCQPECCQYKILTNSPFGHSRTKNTWPIWKYIPGPKQKILPLFVSKGQRVNIV